MNKIILTLFTILLSAMGTLIVTKHFGYLTLFSNYFMLTTLIVSIYIYFKYE